MTTVPLLMHHSEMRVLSWQLYGDTAHACTYVIQRYSTVWLYYHRVLEYLQCHTMAGVAPTLIHTAGYPTHAHPGTAVGAHRVVLEVLEAI